MRKIIDSNFLQREELRHYLKKSTNNFAVITDYASMEAYKGDSLKSIFKSMEILSEFPRQVIILKNTQIVCGLRGRGSKLQNRIIDWRQTQEFEKFCKNLHAAKTGDLNAKNQILEHGRAANDHMNNILKNMVDIPDTIQEITSRYTDKELRIFRKHEPITIEMAKKIFEEVFILCGENFRRHPKVLKLPEREELINTFIFRYTLCSYLLDLRWIRTGAVNSKPEKLRNDVVDSNFAAYATFFDGFLTEDKNARMLYQESSFLIAKISSK